MIQNADIAVVGGGIWGLSAAYHLAQSGQKRIVVLERNSALAQETTPRAAGLVGQIRSNPTMMRAIQYALNLFSQFARQTGHDPGLHQTGSLMVALTPERLAAYEQQVEHAQQNQVEASFVSHEEMARLAPALNTSQVVGGYFVPEDGYVDPEQCAQAYGKAARDLGVHIALGTRVTGVEISQGQVVGVESPEGLVEAGQVLITAGPWSGMLAERAGFAPAMQPIRHQRVCTVPLSGIPDHHPVVRVTDMSCYVRPEKGGYLYGFFEPHPISIDLETLPADFTTGDLEPPTAVMAEAQKRLSPIFPILKELEIAEYRQGITTFAPDGSYLIGPVPGIAGLFLATGCAALGIAGSAAIGNWLAQWMLEGHPGEDLTLFGLERFGDRASDRAWVRRESEDFYGHYYNIRPAALW